MKHIGLLFLLMLSACGQVYEDKPRSDLRIDTVYSEIEEGLYFIRTYMGEFQHGISRAYRKTDETVEFVYRALFLNDTLRIYERPLSDSLYFGLHTYYYFADDSIPHYTSFKTMDVNTRELIRYRSAFFEVHSPDTILFGEPYPLKIFTNIGIWDNYAVKLRLGQLGYHFSLINGTEYWSDSRNLELEITDYALGVNLITGWISFHSESFEHHDSFFFDDPKNTLIFFHQFVVVDKK